MMTKKEQAEAERMKQELRIALALRWTEQVLPDVPKPESGEARGWIHNEHSKEVRRCISTVSFHCDRVDANWRPTSESWAHGGVDMYSTAELCERAMRCKMERRFAKELALCDYRIDGARRYAQGEDR